MTSTSAGARDRCRGLMVGLGVGNLLGVRVESWPGGDIRGRYPGGLREIEALADGDDDWWSQVLRRVDDDDLAQAIILAAACLEGEALAVDDLVRRFWVWGEENGLGIGTQTRNVLARYGGRPPRGAFGDGPPAGEPAGVAAAAAAREEWVASGRDAAGNGAVMRCAPLAIRWRTDDAALVRNAIVSAAATHWDPRCLWSTVVVTLAAAALLREEAVEPAAIVERAQQAAARLGAALAPFGLAAGGAAPDEAASAASAASPDRSGLAAGGAAPAAPSLAAPAASPAGAGLAASGAAAPAARAGAAAGQGPSGGGMRIPDVVVDALSTEAAAPADFGLDGAGMGYTLKAMQVALWCARRADDVEDALIAVINAGGDTDTNGAVAGAMLGARFGIDAIPRRWRDQLAASRPGRDPLASWADRLLAAASRRE